MTMKVTLFFEMGKHGWSESFLHNSNNHANAEVAADRLLQVRVPIMAKQAACTYIRISDIAVKGDSRVIIPVPGGVKGQLSSDCDVPWNSALVRCDAGPLYRRHVWVRGVPDDAVTVQADGKVKYDSALQQAAWNKYFNELVVGGWVMKALNKNQATVSVWSATTASPIVVTTLVAHGFQPGQKVTIDRGKGMTYINGVWTVGAVTALTYELVNSNPPALPLYQLNTARARLHVDTFEDIDKAEIIRLVHRQTGRPFDSSRGRRSARRKAV